MKHVYDEARTARRLQERFTASMGVPTETGCIPWMKPLSDAGYGQLRVRSEQGWTMKGAHVVAWMLVHGPVPEGLTIDHMCVYPACVNVEHLQLATGPENTALQFYRGQTEPMCAKNLHTRDPENRRPTSTRRGTYCHPCHLEYMRQYSRRRRAIKASR